MTLGTIWLCTWLTLECFCHRRLSLNRLSLRPRTRQTESGRDHCRRRRCSCIRDVTKFGRWRRALAIVGKTFSYNCFAALPDWKKIMFIDDVIYVGLLLASVAFGSVFRGLKGADTKQCVSSGIGFAIAFIVSGRHVAHPIICTLINAVILTQGSWR